MIQVIRFCKRPVRDMNWAAYSEEWLAATPAAVMQNILQAMHRTIKPVTRPLDNAQRPPIFFNYLQRALTTRLHGDRQAEQELTSLAGTVNRILEGMLEEGLDVLAQRFKRVEAQDSGILRGDLASRLELIPDMQVTSLSLEEHGEVADVNRRKQRYEKLGRGKSLRRT